MTHLPARRRLHPLLMIASLCSLAACDGTEGDADGAVMPDATSPDAAILDARPRPDAPGVDSGESGPPVFVYGHTRASLYRLDPREARLSLVGEFDCISLSGNVADSSDGMTDLAIDRDGNMFGVGRGSPGADSHVLVRVQPPTGECTVIATVTLDGAPTNVQGLSFVPEGTLESDREVLVGTDGRDAYFRIDPVTAAAVSVGSLAVGSDIRGGDLVSIVDGSSWLITSGNDLVTFDLVSGAVLTERAITGAPPSDSLGWGLGFWGGSVYAFSFLGRLYAIDTTDASLTEITIPDPPADLSFRGAAVTTRAPITPPF